MTEQVEVNRLEKFRWMLQTYIHEELLTDFGGQSKVDVREMPAAALMEHLVSAYIKQEILGETLGTLEVPHPATWFQMLKEQYAPYWLKRHWPVRYAYQKYDARALYPKLALPDEEHNRVWLKRGRREGYEPERS